MTMTLPTDLAEADIAGLEQAANAGPVETTEYGDFDWQTEETGPMAIGTIVGTFVIHC